LLSDVDWAAIILSFVISTASASARIRFDTFSPTACWTGLIAKTVCPFDAFSLQVSAADFFVGPCSLPSRSSGRRKFLGNAARVNCYRAGKCRLLA
jgi:hypothetical protein